MWSVIMLKKIPEKDLVSLEYSGLIPEEPIFPLSLGNSLKYMVKAFLPLRLRFHWKNT